MRFPKKNHLGLWWKKRPYLKSSKIFGFEIYVDRHVRRFWKTLVFRKCGNPTSWKVFLLYFYEFFEEYNKMWDFKQKCSFKRLRPLPRVDERVWCFRKNDVMFFERLGFPGAFFVFLHASSHTKTDAIRILLHQIENPLDSVLVGIPGAIFIFYYFSRISDV